MKTSIVSFLLSLAGATIASAQPVGSIANLSARGNIGQGSSTLIAGFVIEGSAPKSVLVRGVGPGLTGFGVSTAAGAVQILVYDANGNVVGQNDGFQTDPNADAVAQTAAQVGAFPLSASGDSATVVSLQPGAYTVAAAQSASGAPTGQALLEVYDADGPGAASTITNLSTRGMVGSDSGALISGFVISGDVPHDMVVQGVGADLASFGVGNPASDVGVQIVDSNGNVVASTAPASSEIGLSLDQEMASLGALPETNPGDSILPVTLAPGAYTMVLIPSSANTSNSVGLVEVFDGGADPVSQ